VVLVKIQVFRDIMFRRILLHLSTGPKKSVKKRLLEREDGGRKIVSKRR